jgi:hypothetical protein
VSVWRNKYVNGKIYIMTINKPKFYYVGSIIQELEKRSTKHKNDSNSPIFKYRDKQLVISLVCNYLCFSKNEFEQKETKYINYYKLLNKKLVMVDKKECSQKAIECKPIIYIRKKFNICKYKNKKEPYLRINILKIIRKR